MDDATPLDHPDLHDRPSLARIWQGLPAPLRLVAPLSRRFHPLVRTRRTGAACPPPDAGSRGATVAQG